MALNLLADPVLAADAGPSRPVFNRMNLSLAVMEAAKTFHTRWRGILGLDYNRDAPKLHRGGRHPRLGDGGVIQPIRCTSGSEMRPLVLRLTGPGIGGLVVEVDADGDQHDEDRCDDPVDDQALGRYPGQLPPHHQLGAACDVTRTNPIAYLR